jgi:ankyrin repeat protein
LDVQDQDGFNILHCIAALGLGRSAWGLVTVGGLNVNAPDSEGCTPLHLACAHGHQAAVEALLAAGARQMPNNDGLVCYMGPCTPNV